MSDPTPDDYLSDGLYDFDIDEIDEDLEFDLAFEIDPGYNLELDEDELTHF